VATNHSNPPWALRLHGKNFHVCQAGFSDSSGLRSYQQDRKTKPLKRPVVASYNTEAEILAKAERQADDHTPKSKRI